MPKLTLNEIAALSGVSRSTVSRVVNNHKEVRTEVRDRVLQVIAETGYYPNPAARSLASHHSYGISLVAHEPPRNLFADPYFAPLAQGMAEASSQNGYTFSLIWLDIIEGEDMLPVHILRTGISDALIMTAAHGADLLISHLIENGISFVLVGPHPDPRVSFVDVDNRSGAFAITSHLIRLGRKPVAAIGGPANHPVSWQRQQGYLDALKAHGHTVDEALIVAGDFSEAGGYECMLRLLPLKPAAVFVASDLMALGALRALKDHGVAVPEEMALAGYDDLPPAALADPPLTTVHQPIEQLGMQAVRTLIDILENGPQPARRIVLPAQLVIRKSCGARAPDEGGDGVTRIVQ